MKLRGIRCQVTFLETRARRNSAERSLVEVASGAHRVSSDRATFSAPGSAFDDRARAVGCLVTYLEVVAQRRFELGSGTETGLTTRSRKSLHRNTRPCR